MGLKYNLTEVFEKMNDPSSGAFTYEGEKTLPWSNGTALHHFISKSFDGQGKATLQNLYFSLSTLSLRYIQIEGQDLILMSEQGFVERTFTDADFAGLATCEETQAAHPVSSMQRRGLLLL